jgi:site-specific DNA-methyltransferase (adenine-specific)
MKYPDDFVNKIICGDCRDLLSYFPDNSIDAIITDPPFGIDFIGYEDVAKNPDAYWKWFYLIYWEFIRILKPGGFLAIWQTQLYYPYFWQWYGTDIHIYISAKNFVQLRKTPINYAYDPIIMKYKNGDILRPTKPKRNVDFYVSNTASLVSHPKRLERGHPCPRPLDVCLEIIKNFVVPNGIVFDPFLGSGTVVLASKQLGHNFIGIEREQKYIDIANARLSAL